MDVPSTSTAVALSSNACDLVVVIYFFSLEYDLNAAEAGAVVEVDESKCLGVAEVPDPTSDGNSLAAEALGACINFFDKLSFHFSSP